MRRTFLVALFVTVLGIFAFGNLFFGRATTKANYAPTAVNDSYSVHGNEAGGWIVAAPGVLANDSGSGTLVVTTGYFTTSLGTGSFWPSGALQFLPSQPVQTGSTTTTYEVCDNNGCSNATVTLNIHNDPPSISAKSYTFHGGMDAPSDGRPSLLSGVSDPDGDGFAVTHKENFSTSIGTGTLWYNGRVQFVTNNGSQGSASTAYEVCDALGLCSSSTVTFNAYNNAPIPGVDLYFGNYVETATDGQPKLLDNDTDPDGDSRGVQAVTFSDANGSGSFYANGRVTYYSTGNTWFDVRNYTLEDTFGATATGTAIFITDPMRNAGRSCPAVPHPVNVTNGNVWLEQSDYMLPGTVGENIHVNRFYNSMSANIGLFGEGWTTEYDQSIVQYGSNLVQLNLPDGKATYFTRPGTTGAFTSATSDVRGQVVKNNDNTFTLTLKDGRTRGFGTDGRLSWEADRNGNQTTLTYTSGVLSEITDSFGRSLAITTNGNGTVSQIVDSIGTVATYEYYTSTSFLKTVTYADGSKYKFDKTTINGKKYLTTIKDYFDNVVETHAYDSSGRATTSEKGSGVEKYQLDYSHIGDTTPYTLVTHKKASTDDPIETKFYFKTTGARNVVTKVEGLCGCGGGGNEATEYTYDSKLNLTSKTDALSNTTTYSYDSASNLTSVTDVLGTQYFTYNAFGEVLTQADRMNGVTTNTYDAAGNLLTTTDPLTNATTMTYNGVGQLATIEDARGKTTSFDYGSSPLLSIVTDANSKETDFQYNARGRMTRIRNAYHEATYFEYDDNNRLNKVIHPDSNEINIAYDLAGRRTSVTDENGHATTYAYDGAYRLTSITDALSHATSFDYDLMSNLTSQTDAVGNITSLEYDDFNRLKKVTYPVPTASATPLFETYAYNKLGEITTHVDTASHTTSYSYAYAGSLPYDKRRVITTTDELSNTTELTYNARFQMTKVKDALDQEYTFTYDALGRRLIEKRNGILHMSYGYDEVGNRTSRTDHIGNSTSYAYDDLNRLAAVTYGGTTSEYAWYGYDDVSRLVSAVNQNGTVAFTYDNRGRLASETDVFGHVIESGYDAVGNRTTLNLDSNTHTTYAYDEVNRLTTLTDADDNHFTFGYDEANRLISKTVNLSFLTYPGIINASFEYDGMSRLKRLKYDDIGLLPMYDDQYSYNSANQISEIAGLSQTRSFTYDNINRLTEMTDGTNTETYSYDAVGNRTMTGYTTGAFNKLTATSTASYSYDNNGSMTSSSTANYSWDRENRLASASSGDAMHFQYDALGRRVSSLFEPFVATTLAPVPERYTYDGQDVILDDNSDSDRPSIYYQNAPGIDNKLEMSGDKKTYFFLQDHLGSTVGLADNGGSIVETNNYDSFGNPTNSSFSTRYQFTGREFDTFSGLQYSRARYYDPQIGRFISEDSIGLNGGINEYAYVSNNPVNATDPTGLYEIDVHYYLTLYLAMRTGCFSQPQAVAIANADQLTDEIDSTSPGLNKRYANSTYHALNNDSGPGIKSPYLPTNTRNFQDIGRALHYYQDTYSHAGYPSNIIGHLLGRHAPDKTASDVALANEMARGTYKMISDFGKSLCGCNANPWDDDMNTTVNNFSAIPTSHPKAADIEGFTGLPWPASYSPSLGDGQALTLKINALGVPRR